MNIYSFFQIKDINVFLCAEFNVFLIIMQNLIINDCNLKGKLYLYNIFLSCFFTTNKEIERKEGIHQKKKKKG